MCFKQFDLSEANDTNVEPFEILSTLVNPEMQIPAEATAVHGIGDAHVLGHAPFSEWTKDVVRLLYASTHIVGCHMRIEKPFRDENQMQLFEETTPNEDN